MVVTVAESVVRSSVTVVASAFVLGSVATSTASAGGSIRFVAIASSLVLAASNADFSSLLSLKN